MRNVALLLLAGAVYLLGLCPLTYAQEIYYVAPDGDDENPGTLDQPWGTL
ncbi:MAG: hypothetical protein ACUVV0_08760 [Anaerolineae bacterium]